MQFDFFGKTLKILHVDDDEDDFIIIRNLLENIADLSFDLIWVGNYDEALQALRRNEHDLCLVDYYMGEYNGLELINQARATGCEVPFVMLSGTGNRETDLEAMKSGASYYVDKNKVDAYDLERAIRYTLDHAFLLKQVQEFNESLEERVAERTQLLLKVKEELEAEMAERARAVAELEKLRNERVRQTLQRISHSLKARVTADLLGVWPLEKSAPDIFARFVTDYEEVLEAALQRRAYKIKKDEVSDKLRAMADEMGSVQISPRDVVEIYNSAIKHKRDSTKLPDKIDAYVEEGRLTLLELMGYLVSYYRNLVSSRTDS